MKKSSKKRLGSKGYFIIGFLFFVTCWFPAVFLFDAPSVPDVIPIGLMLLQLYIGAFLFAVSSRIEKMEKGHPSYEPPRNLFRVFSLPQKLLFGIPVSFALIMIGGFAGISWLNYVGIACFYICGLGAAVTAVIQAVRNRRRGAASLSQHGGNSGAQTVLCGRCGKKILRSDALWIGTSPYCADCSAAQKAEEKQKKAAELEKALHTPCALCGTDFPQSALHPVEKQMLCDACFQKKYGFFE